MLELKIVIAADFGMCVHRDAEVVMFVCGEVG